MITASFAESNGRLSGFRISGHSGYAESGSDIVCAAVSSMAFLTVNTLTEGFGHKADVYSDEENAVIDFKLKDPDKTSDVLLAGFLREMQVLASDFADNVIVEIV